MATQQERDEAYNTLTEGLRAYRKVLKEDQRDPMFKGEEDQQFLRETLAAVENFAVKMGPQAL